MDYYYDNMNKKRCKLCHGFNNRIQQHKFKMMKKKRKYCLNFTYRFSKLKTIQYRNIIKTFQLENKNKKIMFIIKIKLYLKIK